MRVLKLHLCAIIYILVAPISCPCASLYSNTLSSIDDLFPLYNDTVEVNITINNNTYNYVGNDIETILGESYSSVLDNDTVKQYLSPYNGLFFYAWTAYATDEFITLFVAGFNESVFIELVLTVDKDHQRILKVQSFFTDQDLDTSFKYILSRALEEAASRSIQLAEIRNGNSSSIQVPETGLPAIWTSNITGKSLSEVALVPQEIFYTHPYLGNNFTRLHWEVILSISTKQTVRMPLNQERVVEVINRMIMIFSLNGTLLEISKGPSLPITSDNGSNVVLDYWVPILVTLTLGIIVLVFLWKKMHTRR
jgi:hypothetical protein